MLLLGQILWITNIGRSIYAVINPLWVWCVEGYPIPNEIYLIWNIAVKKELETVIDKITHLYNFLDISPDIKPFQIPEDFQGYFREFSKIIDELSKRSDVELIVFDMTPGRKFMSAIIADATIRIKRLIREKGLKMDAKIVYLHLYDMAYQNVPFPQIPLPKQHLWVR